MSTEVPDTLAIMSNCGDVKVESGEGDPDSGVYAAVELQHLDLNIGALGALKEVLHLFSHYRRLADGSVQHRFVEQFVKQLTD